MNQLADPSRGFLLSALKTYRNEFGLILAIVVVTLIAMSRNDAYLQEPAEIFSNLALDTSLLGIFAIGAAIVIITGGIDLSSGAMITFSASVCSLVMFCLAPVDLESEFATGVPEIENLDTWIIVVAISAAMFVGFLVGTLHTWLITIVRLPPFVATLASLVGLRSLSKLLNRTVTKDVINKNLQIIFDHQGKTLTSKREGATLINIGDETFINIGGTWWIVLIIFLVIGILAWIVMNRTILGRRIYAMGGNEQAALLSGIRTDRLKWFAYCVSSMTASVAGILYAGKISSVQPGNMAVGYELNAIAAAVVGGCSLQGGLGLIPGVMLGALFLRVVIDAVAKIFVGGADDFEGIVVGILVVFAVAFNELRQAAVAQRRQFFPGVLGGITILTLAALAGMLVYVTVGRNNGMLTSVIVAAVLGLMAWRGSRKTVH